MATHMPPKLSVVWICKEGARRRQVCRRYLLAPSELKCTCELIVVVDPPLGGTLDDLAELLDASQMENQVLCLHRHCPDSTALQAGLNASAGDWIALLSSYLQIDVDGLQSTLEKIEAGHDCVTWRRMPLDSQWALLQSREFNALTRELIGTSLRDINSGLRLIRLNAIPQRAVNS